MSWNISFENKVANKVTDGKWAKKSIFCMNISSAIQSEKEVADGIDDRTPIPDNYIVDDMFLSKNLSV
jgi:hypothetical protein